MKKLFLLIPALVLSLATYANPIGPNDPNVTVSNALGNAISNASANAIIELSDGIYQEDGGFSIDKNITIQAAEGANPVIAQKYAFLIVNNAQVTFKGIKFDGGLYPVWGDNNDKHASDHCLRTYDASTGSETLTLDNCEFVNFPSYIIYAQRGNRRMDAITIRNCYFHDNLKSAVYVGYDGSKSTELACHSVTIENSTFANFTNVQEALISIKNNNEETDNIALRVDHCTFYNFVKNTDGDYSFIDCRKSTDVVISNCIFAQPDASMSKATYIYGGAINNCLTFNTNGHRSSSLAHNELSDTDPLFNDLANNKYTYAGEYGVSMSPARGAGTDGSDLGDPRWHTPVTYPSTDFAAPGYACSADAATIPTGVYGLSLYTESEPHYIICSSVAYNTLLGTWAITATRACYVTVGLDLGPEIDNNKHIFEVKILDKDGNPVGSLSEDPADPTGATENNTEANQLKTIDGSILIPAAGDYTIELRNLRGPGKGSIKNIILTYDGDAPITDFAAPGYTFLAKRAELAGNIEYNTTTATPYIQYTDNSDPGTATWIVTVTRACQVKVAMNMVDNSAYSSGNGKHRFVVELLEGNVVKSYVEETSEVDENGRTFPRSYDMPGYITIPAAGDYIIRVRNPRANSRCGLASITLTYSYEGGNVVNIPVAAIPFEDALLHDGATRDGEGLHFMNAQYVEWNIHAAEGLYTFSATCTSSNYSNLTIKVKQGASELYSYTPQYSYNTTDKVISSPQWLLDEGDYTLQLINPTSGNGYVSALSATAASGYFILNDNKTDDGSIAAANYEASNTTYNILLKRSFTAGRYYTICIPMDFYHGLLASKFGEDYELWRMISTEQEGDVINLNFEKYVSDGESQNFEPAAGTPFLLKPSVDVENPVFSTKKVRNYTYNNVKDCGAADFVGSFYKTEIPAGENNLYLQNNNLYYSETNDTPMKGTRAWIRLKPQGPNYVKARIVLGPKVVTSINLVNGELLEGAVKTIEDGQLVIIRDGVKYNAMGIKLQ